MSGVLCAVGSGVCGGGRGQLLGRVVVGCTLLLLLVASYGLLVFLFVVVVLVAAWCRVLCIVDPADTATYVL